MRAHGFIAAALVAVAPVALAGGPHEAPMRELAGKEVRAWVSDPVVVDAIKAQNAKNADLDEAKIVELDKTWRAETKGSDRPLIDGVLGTALSEHLRGIKDGGKGLYTEIFVMDAKGLNVGQSDVTSDYWQGDEAKWKETFLVGADAVHIGEVEKDESTQMFQAQLSLPVVDPASKEVIGAVTVGVNVDELLK